MVGSIKEEKKISWFGGINRSVYRSEQPLAFCTLSKSTSPIGKVLNGELNPPAKMVASGPAFRITTSISRKVPGARKDGPLGISSMLRSDIDELAMDGVKSNHIINENAKHMKVGRVDIYTLHAKMALK
jgi:hypothetical protein